MRSDCIAYRTFNKYKMASPRCKRIGAKYCELDPVRHTGMCLVKPNHIHMEQNVFGVCFGKDRGEK